LSSGGQRNSSAKHEVACRVAKAYRSLVGAASSGVSWSTFSRLGSPASFREHYSVMFAEFSAASTFEGKCGFLLDLFKLQLAFVAILSDW